VVMSPAGLGPENDCVGEDQRIITASVKVKKVKLSVCLTN
jgi:hypothetical protein